MNFVHWWHHLWNPHCEDCHEELAESKVCASCEVLRHQLELANQEKRMLIDALIRKDIVNEVTTPVEEYKPIPPSYVPWRVRRQALEENARVATQVKMAKEKEIKEENKVTSVSPVQQRDIVELEEELLNADIPKQA